MELCTSFLFTFILLHLLTPAWVQASVIECNGGAKTCTVNNYQHVWTDRQACTVSSVAYPTTEAELIQAVAGAVKLNQNIKVVSKFAHSLPKLVCPRGSSGLLISTSRYNSRITVNEATKTVTADAGVELRDLFSKLAEHGLTLPVSPSFNGISVGGVVSTGAHGSGLHGRGGALHDHVVGISIVVPAGKEHGYAKLLSLTDDSADRELLNGARLSIGVLGAISQVTFAVEDMFKRSVVKVAKSDASLEDDILEVAHNYDFGEINWHISQGKTIHTLSLKVPVTTPGEGRNINYTPRSGASVKFWRGVAEDMMKKGNTTAVCESSVNNIANRVATGDGLVNGNNTFKSYPVVGLNHMMETGGGCQDSSFTSQGDKLTCPWDWDVSGQVYFESGIFLPLSKIKQVIRDIKSLRDKNPDKLCVLNMFGGTIFRFIRGSSAYLGSPKDSVAFDMLFFRERNVSSPTLNKDGVEEIQQMLLQKYKGKPHWGKNQDFEFEGVGKKVTNIGKFLKVKAKLDPAGHFSSEWSDAVLGIKGARKVSTVRDGCGLEGLCVCSKDNHCAPDKGYFCKSGIFYKSARVCRKVM